MPSTEPIAAPLPALTFEYRRAHVAAFWAAGATVLYLSAGLLASASAVPLPWVWAGVPAAVVVLPGVLWRPWFEAGVWVWNGVAWRLAAVLRAYVLAVSYYVVFGALERFGPSPDPPARPGSRSGWLTRERAPDRSQPDRLRPDDRAGSLRALCGFASMPGNRWAFCLLPLVLLLTLLRDEQQETAIPGSTYTLY